MRGHYRRKRATNARDLALAYLGASNITDGYLQRVIDSHIARVLEAADGKSVPRGRAAGREQADDAEISSAQATGSIKVEPRLAHTRGGLSRAFLFRDELTRAPYEGLFWPGLLRLSKCRSRAALRFNSRCLHTGTFQ
jgi:hypothetical protein